MPRTIFARQRGIFTTSTLAFGSKEKLRSISGLAVGLDVIKIEMLCLRNTPLWKGSSSEKRVFALTRKWSVGDQARNHEQVSFA